MSHRILPYVPLPKARSCDFLGQLQTLFVIPQLSLSLMQTEERNDSGNQEFRFNRLAEIAVGAALQAICLVGGIDISCRDMNDKDASGWIGLNAAAHFGSVHVRQVDIQKYEVWL